MREDSVGPTGLRLDDEVHDLEGYSEQAPRRSGFIGCFVIVVALLVAMGVVLFVLFFTGGGTSATICGMDDDADDSGGGGTFASAEPSEAAISDVPANYLTAYRAAGQERGIDWSVLAAMGSIESDHGEGGKEETCVNGPANYTGELAQGPMQFLPSTWATVGVDGNGDGEKSACQYEDAIAGAANYLKQSGAPGDYHQAVTTYNRSEAYYREVMTLAESYKQSAGEDSPDEDVLASGPANSPDANSPGAVASLAAPFAMREARAQSTAGGAEGAVDEPRATEFSSTEIDTVRLINDFREENGLEPLEISEEISLASAHYAHDMAKYDAYGDPEPHVSGPSDYYPQNADLKVRMNNEGYYADGYGENIASGQKSAREVFTAWQESPPHRKMMLNPSMTTIGIGLVENPDTAPGLFWVTNFGTEADSTARPLDAENSGGSDDASGGSAGEDPAGEDPAGEDPIEGEPVGEPVGESGGEPGSLASRQAVFPLPADRFVGSSGYDYSDDWGAARPGNLHEGTDIMGRRGTELRSVVPGTVVSTYGSGNNSYTEIGGYSVMVESSVDVGPIKRGDSFYYAHMDGPPAVRRGDTVAAGQKLGEMGSTGYGPEVTSDQMPVHLHFGWYADPGRAEAASGAKNPYDLLNWLAENGGEVTGSDPGATAVASACPALAESGSSSDDGGYRNDSGGGFSGSSGGAGGGPQEGQDLVRAASEYLDTPYILGSLDPAECNPDSIDCSCLVYLAAKDVGMPGWQNLPDDPQAYLDLGEPVEGAPEAGDLIIYAQSGILAGVPGGHVAISTGNGNEVVHAIPPGTTFSSEYTDQGPVIGIRRII